MSEKLSTHQAVITVQNLSVNYGKVVALSDVSFSVVAGEYVGLIGPNGAGKSTLLQAIIGLVAPSTGAVQTISKQRIGYVPQKFEVADHFSIAVKEILAMGSEQWSIFSKGHTKNMVEKLEMVALEKEFLEKDFTALSGGQQQRVIIARSLIHNPDLLLFDEPLVGIDYETTLKIYDLLADLNTTFGLTILFVSHDVEHVTNRCKRVLCLNHHLHEGCHPMDFARGKRGEKQNNALQVVHHHAQGDPC